MIGNDYAYEKDGYCYVMVGDSYKNRNMLINPNDLNKTETRMKNVKRSVYVLYVKFLQTNNEVYLRQAEREMYNG